MRFSVQLDERNSQERVCQISVYLPGVVCDRPAKHLWGYGSIICVCDFHEQLEPTGTETELLTQLFDLEQGAR